MLHSLMYPIVKEAHMATLAPHDTTTALTSSELRQGHIVRVLGMRVLLDSPVQESASRPGTYYCLGLVLNRGDLPVDSVPVGFTAQSDGSHRWQVQGNDLAMWVVEGLTASVYESYADVQAGGAPEMCRAALGALREAHGDAAFEAAKVRALVALSRAA